MYCGSNVFQDYFDDAKELRIKIQVKFQEKTQDMQELQEPLR